LCSVLNIFTVQNTFASASDVTRASTSALDYLDIYVQNYTYTPSDFYEDDYTRQVFCNVETENNYIHMGVLYTTTTLNYRTKNINSNTRLSLVLQCTYDPDTLEQTVLNHETIEETSSNDINGYIPLNSSESKIQKFYLNIKETTLHPQTKLPIVTSTTYVFIIYQISENYNTHSVASFTYKTSNTSSVTVNDLATGKTYPPVRIRVKDGTSLNPTYVNFIRNGENYLIYNIDGIFYNYINDTETLLDDELPLEESGVYEVQIYDRSSLTLSPFKNTISQKFIVKNTSTQTSSIFITATTEDEKQIASGETTNENVILQFHNLLASTVKHVRISKTTATGNIVTKHEYFYPNDFNTLKDYVCSEDSKYEFEIAFNTPSGSTEAPESYFYEFQIIKNIRQYYQKPDTSEIVAQYDNVIQVEQISQYIPLNYGYGIQSINEYNYEVKLARSNPSINGVVNKSTVSGSVNLVIRGVGKIAVTITENGTEKPTIYIENGKSILIKDAGKYKITIIDEMGTTITKSFTLNMQINTAGIVLIAIGGAMILAGIFFIIKSRSKVSVR